MDEPRRRFDALWQAHYRSVLAYALRRVPPDVAADVASETFLRAWRRIDERPEAPRLWLYGIARGIVANQRRSGQRLDALRARISREPQVVEEPVEGVGNGPAWVALERLPPREREAVMLVAWEELSAEDAATVAGCSRATFAVRLHRGRRRMEEHLRPAEPLVAPIVSELEKES